jgi:maltose alpha-D-glucosyltransferase/alpha-amylase
MVTNDERDYMYLAYSADPRMRINVGIRRRLAPLLDNNRRRIELLNSLLFSFPGTPILYYGDEIGMGDNIYLGDRNGVRTPMQWTSDRNAGFSRAVPARLYAPVIMDPIWGYQAINVEAQLSDQSSPAPLDAQHDRPAQALPRSSAAAPRSSSPPRTAKSSPTSATTTPTRPPSPRHRSRLGQRDSPSTETVLCVANLSRFAQPVSLDLSRFAGMVPVEMLGYVAFPPIDKTPYALTLAPYSFLWLELQPAPAVPEAPTVKTEESALNLIVRLLARPLAGPGLTLIQELLPAYLVRQRWFGAKSRTISSVRILDWVELPNLPAAIVFIQITYAEGDPDTYQLPSPSPPAPKPTPSAPTLPPPSSPRSPPPMVPPSSTTPPPAKTSARPSSP